MDLLRRNSLDSGVNNPGVGGTTHRSSIVATDLNLDLDSDYGSAHSVNRAGTMDTSDVLDIQKIKVILSEYFLYNVFNAVFQRRASDNGVKSIFA